MTDGRPVAPSPAKRARLAALAALHDQWTTEHLDAADFDAERAAAKDPSDYNLHYLDVDPPVAAEDEFQARARVIMGLNVATGHGPST